MASDPHDPVSEWSDEELAAREQEAVATTASTASDLEPHIQVIAEERNRREVKSLPPVRDEHDPEIDLG